MRKVVGIGLLLTLAVGALSLLSIAQEEKPSGPPPLLQIIREDVKPGRAAAHEKIEAGWPAAYRKYNIKSYWVGGTPVAGQSEAWFIVALNSAGELEDLNKQTAASKAMSAELSRLSMADSEVISNSRSVLAAYAPDLSYKPDFNIGEYRYLMVDTVRVRLGHGDQFGALRKAINATHEKAGLDEHMLVYFVTQGGASGTVFVFQPLKSLHELDGMAKSHGEGSAYFQATGDEGRKQARDFAMNDELLFERQVITLNPMMSHVSEQVMAKAPDFWKPKMEMAKAPADKVMPAAKKEMKTEKK